MRIDIGIHAQCNRRACFFFARNATDVFQFRFTLDVEAVNALLERVLDFLSRFAHARERALGRIATSSEHTIKFAARNDVETCARAGE
jgi:hypothetical protein